MYVQEHAALPQRGAVLRTWWSDNYEKQVFDDLSWWQQEALKEIQVALPRLITFTECVEEMETYMSVRRI